MKTLVVRKKSTLETMIEKEGDAVLNFLETRPDVNFDGLQTAYLTQTDAIRSILATLDNQSISYDIIDVDKLAETEVNTYALVISAGGDGTLLQTARYVGDISLLGVNTDARPGGSIGFLCATTAQDFSTFYDQYLNGLVDTISLGRLQATWKRGNETQSYFAINDVKIENITGSSTRYSMMINNEEERHMSSFSLVCSALGYTGEMIQIGGEPMELQSKEMQFKVIGSDAREISYGWCMIPAGTPITFRSRMNEGKLLIDGRVHVVDFNYGDLLTVEMDEHPLYLVGFNQKQREDVIQESYGKQKTLLRLKYE